MKAANPREPLSGVCALMPEKILKETFLLSYFCMTKSTKSQQGGLAPSSLQPLAACTSESQEVVRGKCVRQRGKGKIGSFTAPRNLILPRVRTYHTKKPSRFVHASPARPLKVHGGREFGLCADGSNYKPSPVGEGGAVYRDG